MFSTLPSRTVAGTLGALLIGTAGMAAPAAAADLMTTPAPMTQYTAPGGPSHVLWGGIEFGDDVFAGNIGGIWAPHGSLDVTGYRLRAQGVYVDFDYPGGDGQFARGNVAVGYEWVEASHSLAAYVGVDVQGRDYSVAAPTNLDDETGLFLAGRLASRGPVMYPWSLDGDYSTANNTYWTRGRIGYQHSDSLHFGPEVHALGDDAFNAWRVGGYLSKWFGNWGVEVNGGYQDGSGVGASAGHDGGYGGLTLVFLY